MPDLSVLPMTDQGVVRLPGKRLPELRNEEPGSGSSTGTRWIVTGLRSNKTTFLKIFDAPPDITLGVTPNDPPSITFTKDFHQRVHGDLLPGRTGHEAWTIWASLQVHRDEVHVTNYPWRTLSACRVDTYVDACARRVRSVPDSTVYGDVNTTVARMPKFPGTTLSMMLKLVPLVDTYDRPCEAVVVS